MVTKLGDIYTITNTEKNIFYSAYLKNKLQYNDVDPDKQISLENEYQLSKDNSDCLKDNSDPEKYSIDNNINESSSGSSSDVDIIIIESGNGSD